MLVDCYCDPSEALLIILINVLGLTLKLKVNVLNCFQMGKIRVLRNVLPKVLQSGEVHSEATIP